MAPKISGTQKKTTILTTYHAAYRFEELLYGLAAVRKLMRVLLLFKMSEFISTLLLKVDVLYLIPAKTALPRVQCSSET